MTYLERLANYSVVFALIFSPFWFHNLWGVNLGIQDIFLLVAFCALFVVSGEFPITPDRQSFLAIIVFLLSVAASVVVSNVSLDSLLGLFQYILIFIVTIPTAITVFRNEKYRYIGIMGLWLSLNLMLIWAAYESLSIERLRWVALLFSNQNQLFWLISSATILNMGILSDSTKDRLLRVLSAGLVPIGIYMVIGGKTLSAILALGIGAWILGCYLSRHKPVVLRAYLLVSIFMCLIGVVFVALQWEWVYIQGSLGARFRQYSIALQSGTLHQPFGIGLDAQIPLRGGFIENISIHNFFLAYYLEIGFIGALSFTFILLQWCRSVLIPGLSASHLRTSEVSILAIFAAGIVIMLVQPVPVNRYWWLIFSLSWGIVMPSI
ncbi:hypothetical protein [Halosegnis rubeus]|uniref:O-antigen polymerase n=1 Tax=Halosegnis rubeus TaxID=2212850 RepID=A0A5N5ULP5_9EURY|nr:hypothetical protein [Halosegnis rubeus]KAB7519445.1 hypothetical protein DP108_04910 [Halosegnis rubeus]